MEDMYSDAPSTGGAASSDEQEAEGGSTALIPKSLCPGMKPGDELSLKIVRVHDDQYEVSYEKEAPVEQEQAMSEPPAGDTEMAGMMQ